MIYKLYLYGQTAIFGYTEIFNDAFLKDGDVFFYNGKKYKILTIVKTYFEIKFNEKGESIRDFNNKPTKDFIDEFGNSLVITEIPTY